MRSDHDDLGGPTGTATTICRITANGTHWRVQVETWAADGVYRGRFVFLADDADSQLEPRPGPPTLRAPTREALLAEAHDVPERRLRELVHSLG